MRSLFAKLILGIGLVLTTPELAYSQNNVVELQRNEYGYGTLAPGRIGRYRYRVPAGSWGVFTLKNTGRRSDLDIFIQDAYGNEIASGEEYGTETELVITGRSSYAGDLYVTILNYGDSTSNYKLHTDYVNPINRLGVVLAENAISGGLSYGRDARSSENIDRGVTVISSLVQSNSLGGTTQNALVRELTSYVNSSYLGDTWQGELLIDWGASIISGFFEDYY